MRSLLACLLLAAGPMASADEPPAESAVSAVEPVEAPPPTGTVPAPAIAPPLPPRLDLLPTRERRREQARRQRAIGIGVTSAGVALIALGGGLLITLAASSSKPANDAGGPSLGLVYGTFGAISSLSGLSLALPGAIVWGRAQREVGRLESPTPARPRVVAASDDVRL